MTTAHTIPEPALAASGSGPERADRMCMPCIEAQDDPLRHDYTNGCDSCQARAIAQVGSHHESVDAGRVTDRMKEQLQKFFPADPAKGWISVREWGVKVDRARKQKCN